MKLKTVGLSAAITAALFVFGSSAPADTIFMWVDKQNTKRFSPTPPPEGIPFSKIESPSDPSPAVNDRSDYDRMIRRVREESQRYEQEKKRKAAEQKARQNAEKKAAQSSRNRMQRQKLQAQIDALNHRALSPTFTQGMRDAQIETLIKQMPIQSESD